MHARMLLPAVVLMYGLSSFSATVFAQRLPPQPARDFPGAPPAPFAPPLPEGARRLDPTQEVWVNADRTEVILGGGVSLRAGMLEMFACPQGTKEHESVVAVRGQAQLAHAALLVAGAQTGTPVQFSPQYVPATGTEIEISIVWMDTSGRMRTTRAQDWIRDVRTKQPMSHNWVFAGSGFWTDETDGKQYYQGDSGDFICVSNFPSATLDLPVESTDVDSSLLFEAFTEHIPPLDTPVLLFLKPKLQQAPAE